MQPADSVIRNFEKCVHLTCNTISNAAGYITCLIYAITQWDFDSHCRSVYGRQSLQECVHSVHSCCRSVYNTQGSEEDSLVCSRDIFVLSVDIAVLSGDISVLSGDILYSVENILYSVGISCTQWRYIVLSGKYVVLSGKYRPYLLPTQNEYMLHSGLSVCYRTMPGISSLYLAPISFDSSTLQTYEYYSQDMCTIACFFLSLTVCQQARNNHKARQRVNKHETSVKWRQSDQKPRS